MGQDRVSIRWATVDDAQALGETHVASWRAAYGGIVPESVFQKFTVENRTRHFQKAVSGKTEETAVAEVDGHVVGFCTIGECRDSDKPKPTTGEIWGIYLVPSHWRQGIGSVCLRWAETELLSRGKSEAVLWVLEANAPSRRFYEAAGFVADGASKQITIGTALTAIRYVKALVLG